jgi:hypothetical protein
MQVRGRCVDLISLSLPITSSLLSVLGCKYADDVLIDAPEVVTHEMLASLRIDVVLIGCTGDDKRLLAKEIAGGECAHVVVLVVFALPLRCYPLCLPC